MHSLSRTIYPLFETHCFTLTIVFINFLKIVFAKVMWMFKVIKWFTIAVSNKKKFFSTLVFFHRLAF